MLYMSLFVSVILLALANWIVLGSRQPGVWMTVLTVCLIGPYFMLCIAPAATIHSLLLLVAVVLWRRSGRGPAVFWRWSLAATGTAYAVAGVFVYLGERDYSRLRRLYPYESIEARLPLLPSGGAAPALTAASGARLDRLDERVVGSSYHADQLRMLHEDAVGLFINSPGFGVTRMGLPRAYALARRTEPVPPQPGPPVRVNWSPGDLNELPPRLGTPVYDFLDMSIIEFVNNQGFGFFKDRRHVAGFEPHRFRLAPSPGGGLTLRRLELISLLLHDPPVVYESVDLPRMDALATIPTRPLDRFERSNLDSLRGGEDLVYSETRDGVRVLGAVRNLKSCLDCHGGRRGDLLGAFSYVLAPR